jgi:hypothetical protein
LYLAISATSNTKAYIYISGRAKGLVISGGYAKVEAAIEAVPGR